MSHPLDVPAEPTASPEASPPLGWFRAESDLPIRAELLGVERLEALAARLAGTCRLAPPRRVASPLLRRFAANRTLLETVPRRIAEHRGGGLDAEWFADNFHIIEEVLREVKHDLPPGYDQELPKLVGPPLGGYPRVYSLALALVAHTDGELDESRLLRFVRAFQGAAALTIGELWALPTMLRLVLLENLRRLAVRMMQSWGEQAGAERWASTILKERGRAGAAPLGAPAVPDGAADAFIVRALQLLRDQGPQAAAALASLERGLEARGATVDEVLQREHRRQASNQVSVGNCVISLRLLAALDWNNFIERASQVETILRSDPFDVHARQDFATRDRYRRAVERIAKRSGVDEADVARRAVEHARLGRGQTPARGHAGYYLVGRGRAELEAEFGYRPAWNDRVLDWVLRHPSFIYFSAMAVVQAVVFALPFCFLDVSAGAGRWVVAALLALALPATDAAVGLVNQLLTLLLPPRVLPKLEFKDGVPPDLATFIVMPSMLTGPESAALLLERLEIHYLANPDPGFRFALLTDFSDAPAETMPEDDDRIAGALAGVRELNDRYAGDGPDLFHLFHRRRVWNAAQNCWMGWERKRGKLSEFNRLLQGDRETTYAVTSVAHDAIPQARFVITLDADTKTTRDTAVRLVGALAHPLNAPHFDPAAGRVTEGFGVLQPRVSFHLTAATHSRFAALLAASGGIDPYSTAASDAYMDLFGVGSFTGKGIYDVAAFEAATGHTFPENRILSHDLIEGNYARCGLLSDTELFDDFPARYHAYARREHRWVRGDWQIMPWLGRRVPSPDGPRPNPLPLLERWKIVDNLRRSLVPPALVLMLALGWTLLPGPAWVWSAAALGVLSLPLLQGVMGVLIGSIRGRSLLPLKRWRDVFPPAVGHVLLSATFLADQARNLVDAIVRTLWRLQVTRKDLLEWETAAATERRLGHGLARFLHTMWPASALGLALGALIVVARPGSLLAAAPFLLAWIASPVVAYWVSLPRPSAEEVLTQPERRALRRVARKTWRFFETFVGAHDNWLPPDNHQEHPDGRVAHRTSPTNMGLMLLSTLAAHDLGYIGLLRLLERLERSFDTFDRMGRHWGHFFNWYDTRTLQPLPPAYVSTVDSGNLMGCLVTLGRGLREKAAGGLIGPEVREGLADALALALADRPGAPAALDALTSEAPADLLAWRVWLERAGRILDEWRGPAASPRGPEEADSIQVDWTAVATAQWQALRDDLAAAAPWLGPLEALERREPPVWPDEPSAARWKAVRRALVSTDLSLVDPARAEDVVAELDDLSRVAPALVPVAAAVREARALDLPGRSQRLAARAEAAAAAMDFRPLYKEDRHLFALGYNHALGQLDGACYDLLASESALTSYLTVARGDAPRRHWFQLSRPFIRGAGRLGLLSWGGTMFEYLMPRLLLRSLPGTIMAESARTAVARQAEYGRERGVPWGASESGYGAQYAEGDYMYQAFGVPGLGLKRGLEHDLVVAPYATAMAAMVAPREAFENFRRLSAAGAESDFGYYEAIDYTPERLPRGRRSVVVRSHMAHHQGMSLVALANAVLGDPMPRRFHNEPVVRAAELLLQERLPRTAPVIEPSELSSRHPEEGDDARPAAPLLSRRITSPFTPSPRTHLLSNASYHVLLTNGGSGSSRFRDLEVTRWRQDPTRDCWGQFVYVLDVEDDRLWSAGHEPVCQPADRYEVTFAADRATIRRRDGDVETLLEITVSPEQPAEVRRVTLTNLGSRPRDLELTSYVEPVIASQGADLAHPAFNKLFLETERLHGSGALLCRRRPRSVEQKPFWAVHVAAVDRSVAGSTVEGPPSWETDRDRFLGRGRTSASPAACEPGAELSGTTGPVLDPVLALRVRVRVAPGGAAVVAFTTAVAATRAEALGLADQFREASAAARAFELAWAQSQLEHRHRGWSPEETHLYQRLGSHVVFAGSTLRADPELIEEDRLPQSALWRFGISGDRPIVLARVEVADDSGLVRQLLSAHAFLRAKGLVFDLVLLNEEPTSYFEGLERHLLDIVRAAGAQDLSDRPGGVFVRRAPQAADERKLLLANARVVLSAEDGPLSVQLDRIEEVPPSLPPFEPDLDPRPYDDEPVELPPDLLFANGLGGFTPDGREYCLLVGGPATAEDGRNGTLPGAPRDEQGLGLPPAPWSNVVANPELGFLVTEAGSGFTWAGNSQMNRLTPWSNDPVSDPPGEALYIRDEETGAFWSPTPLPVVSTEPVLVRHGQGYTTFERQAHGLAHELTLFVPPDDPVKLVRLTLTNRTWARRRLTVTYLAELVLGTTRDAQAMHVVTDEDPETGALLARNAFRIDFGDRLAFLDVDARPRALTADRAEFLGRHGDVGRPAALGRTGLSGRVGAALDPCAALQVLVELDPGQERELVFLIGEAAGLDEVRTLVRRYREPGAAAAALARARRAWDDLLGAVQVETPDPAFDLLLNRWLLYQVVSCRLWGRSAFYQSGGAFGYRDQLQDVAAVVHAAPELARRQIVLAASRQFPEGDVQHWWHPPAGRGVRTHFSDDFLWLPHVAARYVKTTGDGAVLDEIVPFLNGPRLAPGQEDDYGLPTVSDSTATVYEHCARAIEHGLRFGPHGLPLMGSGDWNDGMNRVGSEGKGESVWVAWFLISTIEAFAELAEGRGDDEKAARWRAASDTLKQRVEENAWDGQWYLRAFFDDGTPLGSASNDECQIDSIAQSWGLISGAADPERARQAMGAVERRLVRRDEGLVLLFDPPFDDGPLQPGYIKGYLPGIRENGGQYTHAAAWVVLATARMGRGTAAGALFRLINPIAHADEPGAVARYRVEPYVVAADLYGRPPHVGRGGWTWYTGSASWLYRVGLEALLGMRREGDRFSVEPCIPAHWPGFELTFRHRTATYHVRVENPEGVEQGVRTVVLDGRRLEGGTVIDLADDGCVHEVEVVMGGR